MPPKKAQGKDKPKPAVNRRSPSTSTTGQPDRRKKEEMLENDFLNSEYETTLQAAREEIKEKDLRIEALEKQLAYSCLIHMLKESTWKEIEEQRRSKVNTKSTESADKLTEGQESKIKELEELLKQDQQEIQVKSERLTKLEETKNILDSEIQELNQKATKSDIQIRELTKEIENLKEFRGNDSSRISELAAEKEKFQKDIHNQESLIQKLVKENVELKKAKESQESLIQKLVKENVELKKAKESQESPTRNLDQENEELTTVKKSQESLIKKLEKENEDLKKFKESQESLIKKLEKENEELKKVKESEEVKIEELNSLKVTVQQQIEKIQRQKSLTQKLEKENAELKKVNESKESPTQKLGKEIEESKTAKESQESLIKKLEKENEELKKVKERVQKLEGENKKLEKQLDGQTPDKLKEEIETLRTRLSRMAGAQLTDDNPAIADLSDPNRPLSLGEKFSELYDNEWTDAMEELMEEDKRKEEEAIKILLDLEAYQFCSEQSEEYMEKINATFQLFVLSSRKESMSKEMTKSCKDFRKSMAVHLAGYVQEKFIQKRAKQFPKGSRMDRYVRKSVLVCWFMTVQDPMVVIEKKEPKSLDEDLYKPYTKKGKNVAFLVWPPIYLHKNGPLIGKGVAQGK